MRKTPRASLRCVYSLKLCVFAILSVNAAETQAAVIVAGELIADLRAVDLDANSTTWTNRDTAGDSVGNFTAKVGNLSVASVGGVDKALYVNQSVDNSVLSSGTVPASVTGNSTRSVEAWIYAEGLRNSQGVVSWGNPSNDAFSRFTYANGGNGLLSAWFNDTGWEGATLPTGEWVHVAWTYDGDLTRGYINGSLIAAPDQPTLNTTSTTVTIGASRPGADADPFQGYIADVRIHTEVLSDNDVANNYAEGLTIPEPSAILLLGLALAGVAAKRWPQNGSRS